jgi:hypothetical protein
MPHQAAKNPRDSPDLASPCEPQSASSGRRHYGIDRPTSDPIQRATGVMTTACLDTEIQRNTGNPEW